MRAGLLTGVVLAVVAGGAIGQPKEGDLVFTTTVGRFPPTSGYTAYLDPTKPATVTTLATAPSTHSHRFVRMAPDNRDVVVGWSSISSPDTLAFIKPGGAQVPFQSSLPGHPAAFELDHDSSWIVTTNILLGSPHGTYMRSLVRVDAHGASSPRQVIVSHGDPLSIHTFGDLAIDRDPGAGAPYCVAKTWNVPSFSRGEILKVDRSGRVTTLPWMSWLAAYAIELHPRTGDYVVSYRFADNGAYLACVSKGGTIRTRLNAMGQADAARILQDDTVWFAGASNQGQFLHYDLKGNAVISQFGAPGQPHITGLEVYGSRRLHCYQGPSSTPGTWAGVDVHSRNPAAAGASYILAASPARRPGVTLPNGEWLDLDATHPLFLATALNLLPQTFVNFRGTLDQQGNCTRPIRVNFPPGLPRLGNMAIFVAGVIYKGSTVIQVTNTHWFVLP
jgi:hypothetical protein